MNCPPSIISNKVNIRHHLSTVAEHGLGPANPKESNDQFWQDKAAIWGGTEGDARGRLCANCEHYINTTFIKNCIDDNEAVDFKTSMVDPSFIDIESKPVAWCSLYDITCSPTRTCDSQEPGGPIDDLKMKALEMAKQASEEYDFEDFPFDSSID